MSSDFPSSAPDLWSALDPIALVRAYNARDVLFEQGQPAQGVFMIHRGKVRLWMPGVMPSTMALDPAGAGTMLGLSETIAHGSHMLSAVAMVSSEIGFVAGDVLMNFLRDHNDICLQVVRLLSEDLHGLYHQFQGVKTQPRNRRRQGNPGLF